MVNAAATIPILDNPRPPVQPRAMLTSRRDFLAMSGAAALLSGPARLFAQEAAATLRPMNGDVVPISREEHLARIARAQRLMGEAGLSALLAAGGLVMLAL